MSEETKVIKQDTDYELSHSSPYLTERYIGEIKTPIEEKE